MNPEPLTKELAQKIFDILKEPDDNIAKHLKIALFVKYEIIKPRVEWLLKEIEKEANKYLDTYSHPDDEALRRILEAFSISITEKIKKAFEGVIEE